MPPTAKKLISQISEITCANCLYESTETGNLLDRDISQWDDEFWTCHIGVDPVVCRRRDYYCSQGLWIISVAQGRPSTVGFQTAYDYLMESK